MIDPYHDHDASNRFQKIDKIVLLAQCPLFAGLSQWELRSISQLMRLVEYKKDEVVYQEGGDAESFYVIVSGRFEAYTLPFEKKKILAYLRKGDYFGEMSLLTNEPHSATIKALSDSMLLEIKKDDFKKSIENNATISLELSRRLSARLRFNDSRKHPLYKCDVVSIFSCEGTQQRGPLASNLASSLFVETHQKTVLVDLQTPSHSKEDSEATPGIPIERFHNIETSDKEALQSFLTRTPAGYDSCRIVYDPKDTRMEDLLIAVLNHLAIDYRFILVNLHSEIDGFCLKTISQSDSLLIFTESHLNNLTEAKDSIIEIEKSVTFAQDKISLLIQDVAFGAHTTPALRQELFGKKKCFFLPARQPENAVQALPLVLHSPDAEYSRVIRHVARYLSGNLVGLALGSGAALGLAHIGVLKVLEREKIPVDIIAGSSIGALIGSLYAVGVSVAEIEQAALEVDMRLLASRLVDLNIFPVRGLMHGKQVIRHFQKHLSAKSFEQCRISLKITGADLTTRESFIFETGLVSDAVRASIAIPAIIKPVIRRDGNVIVDGGILNPLPIRTLHESGANKVIAVNVFPSSKDMLERRLAKEELQEKLRSEAAQRGFLAQGGYWLKKSIGKIFFPNIFDILMNTIQAMEAEIAEAESGNSDVLLRPVIATANWVDFFKPEPFIRRGEEEALKLLPKIKSLVSQYV